MLDTTDPYISYIAVSYGLAAVVLPVILFVQLRQYRRTRQLLDLIKGQQ